MHNLIKLLRTFEYDSISDLFRSMFPSLRYQHFTILTISFSYMSLLIDRVFGLTAFAFWGMLIIMVTELVSGIWASKVKSKLNNTVFEFSSTRLSRFGFKSACYLVLIAVPYMMSQSYHSHGIGMAGDAFIWLHVFMVIQIIFENTVSILENVGVIMGKDKTFWINKIKSKLTSLWT